MDYLVMMDSDLVMVGGDSHTLHVVSKN
jgi:hypothetical protein